MSNSIRILNTIMTWLLAFTVLVLNLPWQDFAPQIADRITENKNYLYFALIVEISNFVALFINAAYCRYQENKHQKKLSWQMSETIANLDFSERALLREYVLQRKSVLNLPLNEPTVRNLLDTKVLRIIGQIQEDGKAPIRISQKARPFITYKAIGLSRRRLNNEEIGKLMSTRPNYARPAKVMPKSFKTTKIIKAA